MNEVDVLPELKQIVGAMLFVAKQPLSVSEIRRVMVQVAEIRGGPTKDFGKASESDIRAAIERLKADLAEKNLGLHISEVANGYRLENDANCGPWLRHLLEKGRPTRLSRPALETLAIIAYRQPCTRGEIEAVRGVQVDQIVRNLLEMQLIRIAGRSELPGRPWQFGTTQKFLEHFGLKAVDDLPGVEELRRMEDEQIRKTEDGAKKTETEGAAVGKDEVPEAAEEGTEPEPEDEYEDDDEDDEEEEGEEQGSEERG